MTRNKAGIKKAAWIVLAVVVVLSLHCEIQIVKGDDSNAILHFFSRWCNSFSSYSLTDLFVFAAVYAVIRYVASHDRTIDVWTAALSGLFSVSYVLSSSYMAFDSLKFLVYNRYQMFLSGFCMLGFCLLFYFCIRMMFLFVEKHSETFVREDAEKKICDHFLLYGFLTILICWLPWIWMSYPGSFCWDAQCQLQQFFGDAAFTAHHPPLSTYIMGALVVVGDFFVDKDFGCFLYLLLQTCVGAWVFAFGVKKLYAAGIRFRCCALMILFYALTPFWGCFAQWYEKDLLYSEVITLFLICLIDIVIKRECGKKDALLLALSGVLASLLRNNGIYAVLPAIFLLAFYVGKRFRKAVWISLLSTALVYCCFVKMIYPFALGIENGSVREALSIPFQQTARYVKYHGDEVTEYEKHVIDSVLDYESLAETYDPILSDPVKDTYKEDSANLSEYFKVWLQMFWKRPVTYISALLNGTYGYIAPLQADAGREYIEPVIMTAPEAWFNYLPEIGVHRAFKEFPARFFIYIRSAGRNAPLIKYLSMPGLYTWIVLICALAFLKKKKYGLLLILVPELMNILACVASPLANAIRYQLPVMAAAPLLVGWTCLGIWKDKRANGLAAIRAHQD